jgi:hypothetical protein
MTNDMSTTERMQLEQHVDTYGISGVLRALMLIAGEKAEHIAVSYSTSRVVDATAKAWTRRERMLNRFAREWDSKFPD